MATTIDDVMVKIGEFRRYQWYLLNVIGYTLVTLAAFPTMIASFITAEPDWKCLEGYMNNTVCRFNKSITLTSDDYKARCEMPREAWTFVSDFNSAVTEVGNIKFCSVMDFGMNYFNKWVFMGSALPRLTVKNITSLQYLLTFLLEQLPLYEGKRGRY